MWIKILLIFAVCVYIAINLLTSKFMTAEVMKKKFVNGQCLVGKIFANVFYAPAWFLKGIKFVVLAVIA